MGDETMIKVVIADDEVRICQLILALVDWEALGLKVVGTAHNGLEAIAMVRTLASGHSDYGYPDAGMQWS